MSDSAAPPTRAERPRTTSSTTGSTTAARARPRVPEQRAHPPNTTRHSRVHWSREDIETMTRRNLLGDNPRSLPRQELARRAGLAAVAAYWQARCAALTIELVRAQSERADEACERLAAVTAECEAATARAHRAEAWATRQRRLLAEIRDLTGQDEVVIPRQRSTALMVRAS